MRVEEFDVTIDEPLSLGSLEKAVWEQLSPSLMILLRLVITVSHHVNMYHCEVGLFENLKKSPRRSQDPLLVFPYIFKFGRRIVENTDSFNVVLIVPTGIGAEIGGHAGDAGPVAKLLASSCDTLITHPNVVNGSDINEMPENALYVEGSVITRLLMGTVGLEKVRSNRVLVVLGNHDDDLFTHAAVNSVNAAQSTYGLRCPAVEQLGRSLRLKTGYTSTGSAGGSIEGFEELCAIIDRDRRGNFYDAVAISSVIDVPEEYHMGYFQDKGQMVNPWGGVEAMLTHAISSLYNVPSAHSPMFESREVANMDPGVVDPRMAAEAVSCTFLQCVLKGLHRSPRIVTEGMERPGVLSVENVSCLVIPNGCLGLPTLAALEQGIPVIAVRENRNVMRNNLLALPWAEGQFHSVGNYWEAAGVLAALKAGIDPGSVRRPLKQVSFEKRLSPEMVEA